MVGAMAYPVPTYISLGTLIDGTLRGYAIVRRAVELADVDVRPSTRDALL
jgi:hypothetical protein